jgi:indolepyruvate ferredoxin oxidoreductase beta subunit
MVVQEKIANIVIAGAGGQGNLFASKVLAQAAVNRGLEAKIAETYGVAQRGGSVHSQVRFGKGEFGPLIPAHNADAILGLEPLEALRLALDYACESTVVITNSHATAPMQSKVNPRSYPGIDAIAKHLESLQTRGFYHLDAYSLAQDLDDARVMNMVMVGALLKTDVSLLTLDDVNEAVETLAPRQAVAKNIAALAMGFERVQAHGSKQTVNE